MDPSIVNQLEVDKEKKLYEIIVLNILKYLDIILAVFLYIGGTNQVDVFHIILLVYFTMFIVYPRFMRINFIYFINFLVIVAILKYLYVLLAPEIEDQQSLSKTLNVLGLVQEFGKGSQFWRSSMLNDTSAVVLLAYLQYQLYKSNLLQGIYHEKTKTEERIIFNVKYPKALKLYIYCSKVIGMLVPWGIYVILISLVIVLDKTIINFQFAGAIILVLLFH